MTATLMTDYPNGFKDGISIRGMPLLQTHTGKVFWVYNGSALLTGQSAGSDGNRGTFNAPFATLDYAIGRCTANRGDVIMVKPGHAETISSATALALDVAGIAIVGQGYGSTRPTFTLDTATTTTIGVSAANISIQNCIFTANFADIVSVFTLTAAKYFTLDSCYIKATATNMNFLNVIDTNATSNDADGLRISRCKWIEPDAATLGLIQLDGTNDDIEVNDCIFRLGVNNNKALIAAASGKIATGLRVVRNYMYRLNTDSATGGLIFSTDGTTSTGIIAYNVVQHADTAAEILLTASNLIGCFDNKCSGVAGASGYLLPAADS